MRRVEKKKTIKNKKKATKYKRSATLRLDNDETVLAKSIYKKDSRVFNTNDIEIDKIRLSDKNLYIKKYESYKHYVFYEDDEYISLEIILFDVQGFCNDHKDNGKKMNFKLDNGSLEEIIDIF